MRNNAPMIALVFPPFFFFGRTSSDTGGGEKGSGLAGIIGEAGGVACTFLARSDKAGSTGV
jgi:hypothetical protein